MPRTILSWVNHGWGGLYGVMRGWKRQRQPSSLMVFITNSMILLLYGEREAALYSPPPFLTLSLFCPVFPPQNFIHEQTGRRWFNIRYAWLSADNLADHNGGGVAHLIAITWRYWWCKTSLQPLFATISCLPFNTALLSWMSGSSPVSQINWNYLLREPPPQGYHTRSDFILTCSFMSRDIFNVVLGLIEMANSICSLLIRS